MADESKTSGRFFDVVLSKELTEAILKNISWFFAITTLIRILPTALNEHEYLFAALTVFVFLGALFLNLAYGVNHILIPIDKGIGGHIVFVKDLNKLKGQSDTRRIKRVIYFLFGTRLGWIYMVSSFLYIWFAFTAMGLASMSVNQVK